MQRPTRSHAAPYLPQPPIFLNYGFQRPFFHPLHIPPHLEPSKRHAFLACCHGIDHVSLLFLLCSVLVWQSWSGRRNMD
ncbi:ubiquitin-conjugating enzyme E2-16 kDa [Histoplasma capsulatum]|uniref:Ubiquitin-conjugating enzyme E2-16 kDa n=1 Tax=Ajellomyces capsulatus TaxID=5037 RepID=A0A8A1LZ78_AJECA|nr:ubiquitin-conjugating enzyme E2-16 kDa [Histoplasma capsulatum]